MATVTQKDVSRTGDGSALLFQWTLTSADATGVGVMFPEFWQKSVHFNASAWGTATAALEGGNQDPATDWQPLQSMAGVAITATANGIQTLRDSSLWFRPRLSTVGAGATVVVSVLAIRASSMRT